MFIGEARTNVGSDTTSIVPVTVPEAHKPGPVSIKYSYTVEVAVGTAASSVATPVIRTVSPITL